MPAQCSGSSSSEKNWKIDRFFAYGGRTCFQKRNLVGRDALLLNCLEAQSIWLPRGWKIDASFLIMVAEHASMRGILSEETGSFSIA